MSSLTKMPVPGLLLCLALAGCGTTGSMSGGGTTNTPSPDFMLAVSPATLTLTAGGTAQVSVTATAISSFNGAVSVAISGLPAGVSASPATLTLTPGMAQSTTLSAAADAAAATPTIMFKGTSGSLSHSASLSLTVKPMLIAAAAPDVITYHYDNARDGLNSQETILTPSNVNSSGFGKIGFDPVDGKVDAEPLYLANVSVENQMHNALYVATEHGTVYAFDADNGTQLWKTSTLGANETTSDNHNCGQIAPEIGITSTPVIDRKLGPNGTLFTVAMSKDASGAYHQRLHALDLATGDEISGSPTEITASYPGRGANSQNGEVVFDPAQYAERAGLLLLNGNIYLGWTSHCDQGPYTGWVMAYSESTLLQTQVLNLTPNGSEGSIWMSGDGMAADSQGFVYLLDANGTFDTVLDANGFPGSGDFGNAMVKLSTNPKLAVADYFATFDTVSETNNDTDLGSGGELLLPDQTDSNGNVHHLIVGGGKDKNIYLADRDNMGKFNPSSNPANGNIYQWLSGQMAGLIYSTPAYFNGVLYYSSDGDSLKAFPLTDAKISATPSSVTAAKFSHPGTTPSISANGTQNGIVWALESGTGSAGVLHAYDPTNLAHEFYNSNQAANGRDGFGNGNKFITPMIVNGKVYVGTQNGVAVFGLLNQ
ncbi:MAG TPA: pyrrolo-quinoline quinone [Silvibacterium sp.]|nr:pyrrolo-quinoline quinone [Silvibacterium sp.]